MPFFVLFVSFVVSKELGNCFPVSQVSQFPIWTIRRLSATGTETLSSGTQP